MDMGTAVRTCFSKYATFAGRATRPEYWYFLLFNVIASLIAGVIDAFIGISGGIGGSFSSVALIVGIALFLPSLAVLFRRLHDTDCSGWWWLIGFVPIIAVIVLIVFLCERGTEGANRFA